MLYKIEEQANLFKKLKPLEFKDFSSFGKLADNLENLIASSILDVLFEEARLMPAFQRKQRPVGADIYALNEIGESLLFSLKRSTDGEDAVNQALRYMQNAGQWSYQKLEEKFHEQNQFQTSIRGVRQYKHVPLNPSCVQISKGYALCRRPLRGKRQS